MQSALAYVPLTTIPLDSSVRDRLKGYGRKGMTYNDILTRMMDELDLDTFVRRVNKDANAERAWVPADEL